MNCPNCNNPLDDGAVFCTSCGATVDNGSNNYAQNSSNEPQIPDEYKPLKPWTYFWLNVLFAVPVVGFIFLIIFSFVGGNYNRRNYARSFWCPVLIAAVAAAIFFIVVFIVALISGASMDSMMNF